MKSTIQKRRYAPKSRSGCQTCKQRRIKCDEQHPACQRCLTSGKRCQGYGSGAADKAHSHVIWTVGSAVPGSDLQEQACFHSFLKYCARDLAGSFGEDLWLYLAPQLTWSDEVLRHAIVALGAGATSQAQRTDANGGLSCIAARQYAIALKRLRLELASHDPARTSLSVLLACLLFVTFEVQRRAHEEAEQHLSAGIRILRSESTNRDSETPVTSYTRSETDLLHQLRTAFVRLDLEFSFYNSTRIKLVDDTADFLHVADDRRGLAFDFDDIAQAEQSLNLCLRSMREFMYAVGVAADSITGASPLVNSSLRLQQSHVLVCLARWDTGMNRLLPSLKGDRDIAIAALLRTHRISAQLQVDLALSVRPQPDWKLFTTRFREILDNAERFMTCTSAQDHTKAGYPRCGLEMGVVPPLYLTLLRCDDSEIRSEALQLLKQCSRREGLWDGPVFAAACERMLQLGTAGENLCGDTDCSATHRQLCHSYFDVHTGRGSVYYRRRCFKDESRWIEFQVCLSDDRSEQYRMMRMVHQHAVACYEQGIRPRKPLTE